MWCSEECRGFNWEAKLITDLLRDYNKYARPTINVSEPIHTTIAFYLTKILGLVSNETGDHLFTVRYTHLCAMRSDGFYTAAQQLDVFTQRHLIVGF